MHNKNIKSRYCEALTGEILGSLSGIIDKNISDKKFLDAQDKVRNIILREYVEKEDQL